MATLVHNSVPQSKKGESYKVVCATRKEFIAIYDDECKCFLCDDDCDLDEKMYYIPVLDVIYCKRCYELWVVSAQYFKVDKPIETKRLNAIMDKFKELDCWFD